MYILGDPGADSGGEGKSKRAEKYGTKKSKERRCFSAQSEARTAATVWNWSGKTLSPGALIAVLYFSSIRAIFFQPFRLSLAPTICPWVSEDVPCTITELCVTSSLALDNWGQWIVYTKKGRWPVPMVRSNNIHAVCWEDNYFPRGKFKLFHGLFHSVCGTYCMVL